MQIPRDQRAESQMLKSHHLKIKYTFDILWPLTVRQDKSFYFWSKIITALPVLHLSSVVLHGRLPISQCKRRWKGVCVCVAFHSGISIGWKVLWKLSGNIPSLPVKHQQPPSISILLMVPDVDRALSSSSRPRSVRGSVDRGEGFGEWRPSPRRTWKPNWIEICKPYSNATTQSADAFDCIPLSANGPGPKFHAHRKSCRI